MSKVLIIAGLVLIAAGVVWFVAERFGLGRLSGDIVVQRENFRLYLPIMTSILISVALSFIIWLINRS